MAQMTTGTKLAVGLAAGVALYLILRKLAEAGSEAAQAVLEKISPLSETNIFYTTAGAAVEQVTGDERPLGVQLWEWWNPEALKAEEAAIYGPPPEPERATDEDFEAWLQATGGVLKPGETQQQAISAWIAAGRPL